MFKTCSAFLQPKSKLSNIFHSKENRLLNERETGNSEKNQKREGKGCLKKSEMMLNLK